MHGPRHYQLVLFTTCLLATLTTVGISLPYPILAPLFMDAAAGEFNNWLGIPAKLLFGIALAVNPIGILIGSAILGPMSDKHGRRKVMIVSLSVAALCYALSAYALHLQSFWLFALARFATGFCEGNIAIARAVAVDLHPHIEKTKALAWMNGSIYGGWLIGPLIGGLTVGMGAPVPFWIATVAMLPCLILLALVIPETRRDPSQAKEGTHGEMYALRLLREPGMLSVFMMQLFYGLGLNAFYEFFPLLVVEHAKFSAQDVGLTVAASCALMIFASWVLVGPLARAFPTLTRARWSLFLIVLIIAALPFLGTPWNVVDVILIGAPVAMFGAAFPVYCSDRYDYVGQGSVMGMLTTTFCLANAIVALLGSAVTLIDTRWTLWLGALFCLIAWLQLLQLPEHKAEVVAA